MDQPTEPLPNNTTKISKTLAEMAAEQGWSEIKKIRAQIAVFSV
jgi:hypothetical protein